MTLATPPAPATAALAARGISWDAVHSAVPIAAGDLVLLTGSFAAGETNPNSDLDLLALGSGGLAAVPAGAADHPSLWGSSYDVWVDGLPVNVECVDIDVPARLVRLLDRAIGGAPPALPNMQVLDARLLCRAATGVVLQGERPPWLAAVDPTLVAEAFAALMLVMGFSYLRDGFDADDPLVAALACRSAVESLAYAALSAQHSLTYDLKHVLRRTRALRARGEAVPSILRDVERALFPGDAPVETQLRDALEHARDLWARWRVGCPRAAAMLAPLLRGELAWAGLPPPLP